VGETLKLGKRIAPKRSGRRGPSDESGGLTALSSAFRGKVNQMREKVKGKVRRKEEIGGSWGGREGGNRKRVWGEDSLSACS